MPEQCPNSEGKRKRDVLDEVKLAGPDLRVHIPFTAAHKSMSTSWWQRDSGRNQTGSGTGEHRFALHWPPWKSASAHPPAESAESPGAPVVRCPCHKLEFQFNHLVEANQVTDYLLHELHCDDWYVACQRDHQLVVRLTESHKPKYAICYQCRPGVEKAVYHGNRAWALSVIPLSSGDNLTPEREAEIKSALARR